MVGAEQVTVPELQRGAGLRRTQHQVDLIRYRRLHAVRAVAARWQCRHFQHVVGQRTAVAVKAIQAGQEGAAVGHRDIELSVQREVLRDIHEVIQRAARRGDLPEFKFVIGGR